MAQDLPHMQPRPPFDQELLIPIAIAVVSILGLAWILLANYSSEPPPSPTIEPTAIPFTVTPRNTGRPRPTSSATSTPEATEEPLPTATGTSSVAYPGPPDTTASTLTAGSQPAPAPDQGESFSAGRYDDTHPDIVYDRFWAFKSNPGTANAYKGTLHISTNVGNELSFRFTGQGLILGYQRGKNFGVVTVIIDNQTYSFHEQAFDRLWRSPQLPPGNHSVRLIHQNGESVNLDYIEVIG